MVTCHSLCWHTPCSVGRQQRKEIDYEKAGIDITEYSHGIVFGALLFTCPEKVTYGISTGGVSIF